MKRYWLVAAAAVLGAIALYFVQRDSGSAPTPDVAAAKWYHESDVALLSSTGRPQLVEFFHPT